MLWHLPNDPDCPDVMAFYAGNPSQDAITEFERTHRLACKHCEQYGLAHVECFR